jgi:hypothetical protein
MKCFVRPNTAPEELDVEIEVLLFECDVKFLDFRLTQMLATASYYFGRCTNKS